MTTRHHTAPVTGSAIQAQHIAGRYTLFERLGAGGMATVYLARLDGPAGMDKLVAIKRIHPHLATEEPFVLMFLDEWRIAAQIEHPNVCSVLDFGQTDETYFLAMEYIMGETLLSFLSEMAGHHDMLDTERWRSFVAHVIAEAAEGLHAAHELCDEHGQLMSVVHRDVSPDNIFVTYEGAVKVTDFGVARAKGQIHQTRSGTIKGKYGYMAPEIVYGDTEFDRRADIWGLGVCMWELLTGTRLFRRETDAATISAVANDPILRPSTVRAGIAAELDEIVMRTLSREPENRHPSGRELSRQLRRYLAGHGELMDLGIVAEITREIHVLSLQEKENQRRRARASGSIAAQPDDLDTDRSAARRVVLNEPATASAVRPGPGRVSRVTLPGHKTAQSGRKRPVSEDVQPGRAHSVKTRVRRSVVAIAGVASLAVLTVSALHPDDEPEHRDTAPALAEASGQLSGMSDLDDRRASRTSADVPVVLVSESDNRIAASGTCQPVSLVGNSANSGEKPADAGQNALRKMSHGERAIASDRRRGTSANRSPGLRSRAHKSRPVVPDKSTASTGNRESELRAERGRVSTGNDIASKTATTTAAKSTANDAASGPSSSGRPGSQPSLRAIDDLPSPLTDVGPFDRGNSLPPPSRPKSFAAAVELRALRTRGALSRAQLGRAVKRGIPGYLKCYRSAAWRAGKTLSSELEVKLEIELEIDELGRAQGVRVKNSQLPGLAPCIQKAVGKIRTRHTPDVGRVQVLFEMVFRPKEH
ncbi:MAG: protein kinase [Proteobacteria bacterium]|nr:protein kinase [Pseudomonadota bacterium]